MWHYLRGEKHKQLSFLCGEKYKKVEYELVSFPMEIKHTEHLKHLYS